MTGDEAHTLLAVFPPESPRESPRMLVGHKPSFRTPGKLDRLSRMDPCAPLLEPMEPRRLLAVIAWDGGATGNGTSWADPTNWAGDVLPGPADDAVIGPTGANPLIQLPTVNSFSVRSFTLSRALDVRGTLTTSQASTVDAAGSITLTGGTLSGGTITSTGSINATNTTSTISNVTINGDITLAASSSTLTLAGNSSFTTLRLSAQNGNLYFAPGTNIASGLISIEGAVGGARSIGMNGLNGAVTLGAGVTIRTDPTLTTANVQIGASSAGGNMTLTSNATIIHNAPGRILTLSPAVLNSSGSITATQGTLTLGAPSLTNTGTIAIGAAGTLNLGSTVTTAALGAVQNTLGGTLNITGTINNSGNTLALNASTGSWSILGGTISGGTLALTGGSTLLPTSLTGTLAGVTVNGEINLAANNAGLTLSGNTSFTALRLSALNANLYFAPGANVTSGLISIEGSAGGARSIGMNGFNGAVTFGSGVTFRVDPTLTTASVQIGASNAGGNMTLTSSAAIVHDAPGRLLTLAPAVFTNSGSIAANQGTTTISAASWTNPGGITVGAAGIVNLAGSLTVASIGSIQNIAGGAVNITGTINNTATTLNLNATTGSWTLRGGTITGGTLNLSGGSTLITTNTSGTLAGVTVNGEIAIASSNAGLTLSGNTSFTALRLSAVNASLYLAPDTNITSGLISIEGPAGGFRTIGMNGFNGTVTFGAGVIVRSDPTLTTANAQIGVSSAGGNMTLLSNAAITSNAPGRILTFSPALLTNSGSILATQGTITISSTTWTNSGSLAVGAAGTLNLGGTLTTAGLGSLQGAAGGVVNITGAINNTGSTLTINDGTGSLNLLAGSITGGTINMLGSARLISSSGSLTNVSINGEVTLAASSSSVTLAGTVSISTLRMTGSNTSVYFAPGSVFATGQIIADGASGGFRTIGMNGQNGAVTLGAGSTITTAAGLGGSLVLGVSNAGGNMTLLNNGTILGRAAGRLITVNPLGGFTSAGLIDLSPGVLMNVASTYTQTSIGGFTGRINGLTTAGYGRMTVTGAAMIDGTFTTIEQDGFVYDCFNSVDFIVAGSLTGQFATVNLPAPTNFVHEPLLKYAGGTTVRVYIRHIADFNDDGTLNADDLGDFITAFFSPDRSTTDFNHDGNFDADDLGDFITAYFAPC